MVDFMYKGGDMNLKKAVYILPILRWIARKKSEMGIL